MPPPAVRTWFHRNSLPQRNNRPLRGSDAFVRQVVSAADAVFLIGCLGAKDRTVSHVQYG